MNSRAQKAVILAAASAVLARLSIAEAIVSLASPSEVATETEAAVGSLHWHQGGNGAFLSIGNIERNREAIVDPYALHRAPFAEVAPPAYSIDLGPGVGMSNGWFVLFANMPNTSEYVTRTVTLRPADGCSLRRAEITNCRGANATVAVADGGIAISCTSVVQPPGMQTYTDCAFRLDRVFASVVGGDPPRDDLNDGDYLFTDSVGDCSLGTLREWCLGQHKGRMADSWSRYPATEAARLADSPLVFDRLARFRTGLASGTNHLDTLAIYAGGKAAVEIVSEVSDAYSGFRIVDFRQTATNVCMWVTAIGTNCTAETSTALSPAMAWTEEENVTVDYTPTKVNGIDCYLISFPCGPANSSAGMRFWRARTTIGIASRNAVRVNVPVILTAPNGSRWELRVSDDGTLSTVAAP